MGVANTKSNIITNADASPIVPTAPHLAHGRVRSQRATVPVAAADDNDSVYRFFRVFTSWHVLQLLLWNDALASGSDFNIGGYDTAERGGAVILENAWGDAITMASARLVPLDCTFEQINIDKIEKSVWEQLGLTTDPRKFVDICITADVVGVAAGDLSMLLYYTDGS